MEHSRTCTHARTCLITSLTHLKCLNDKFWKKIQQSFYFSLQCIFKMPDTMLKLLRLHTDNLGVFLEHINWYSSTNCAKDVFGNKAGPRGVSKATRITVTPRKLIIMSNTKSFHKMKNSPWIIEENPGIQSHHPAYFKIVWTNFKEWGMFRISEMLQLPHNNWERWWGLDELRQPCEIRLWKTGY